MEKFSRIKELIKEFDLAKKDLTENEKDVVGEISNICIGSAATSLSALVNKRVDISTPTVTFTSWESLIEEYAEPQIIVKIAYTTGLIGENLFLLKKYDTKVITDLMMGGTGTNVDGEINDMHLSAICEAMNQMIGTVATAVSEMVHKKIDISFPESHFSPLEECKLAESLLNERFIKISFKISIGELVNSELMQIYPASFLRELCNDIVANVMI